MGIESCCSLYPYPTFKEVITMLRNTYVFEDPKDLQDVTFPVHIKQDYGDGTYACTFDTSKMSLIDRSHALSKIPVIPNFSVTGVR